MIKKSGVKSFVKYFLELLVVVFGVYLGFMANNYSEEQKQKNYTDTTIQEMYSSLGEDIRDAELNKQGHESGLKSVKYFGKMIKNQAVNIDSFHMYYFLLTRTFVSIQNIAAFDAIKSRGLNLIENDSIRTKIIKLYDFQYDVLEKIEEKYQESQLYANESRHIADILARSLKYDENAILKSIKQPLDITPEERSKLILILLRINNTRYFNISIYDEVISDMKKVRLLLEKEYPFVISK